MTEVAAGHGRDLSPDDDEVVDSDPPRPYRPVAHVAEEFEAAARIGQGVGEDPRELAGLVCSMAALAAHFVVGRHRAQQHDDDLPVGFYL